jgi:hypothetical protein
MFSNLILDSCIGNKGGKKGGEKLHCIPRAYPKSQGGACAFLLHFLAFVGCGLLYLIGLTDFCNQPDRFGGTGLTGFGNRPDRFVPKVGTFSEGVCICAGGAPVCFGGLCSLPELVFDSVVSCLCPCLRGSSLSSFK